MIIFLPLMLKKVAKVAKYLDNKVRKIVTLGRSSQSSESNLTRSMTVTSTLTRQQSYSSVGAFGSSFTRSMSIPVSSTQGTNVDPIADEESWLPEDGSVKTNTDISFHKKYYYISIAVLIPEVTGIYRAKVMQMVGSPFIKSSDPADGPTAAIKASWPTRSKAWHSEYHHGRAVGTLQFNCYLSLFVTLVVGLYSFLCSKYWINRDFMRYKPIGVQMDNHSQFILDSEDDGDFIKEVWNVEMQNAAVGVPQSAANGSHL
ncbi:hypothetical protein OROGR_018322 [Orobanche gracilis]